jgi:membrane fusion protein (multidrug efflux system)
VDSAILIPQKSTYEIQGKKFVYKVLENGKVTGTEIKTMENTGGKFYVVLEGLKAGDRIVFEGVAGLREGALIQPIEINADSVLLQE